MMKAAKKKATKTPKRNAVRRRVWPRWMRPVFPVSVVAVVLGGLGGAGVWAVRSGMIEAAVAEAATYYELVNRSAGLVVREVLVDGRQETSRERMLAALKVNRGDLILTFDVDAARERLQGIGWIASARVERHLPDTIRVSVVEHVPVAVWQDKGKFRLVDTAGTVIRSKGVERFRDLKIIVGKDAPKHAQALIAMLQEHPKLMARVKAAFRSGGRRWNLRMDNGIDVRLPETDAFAAWDRLAKYEAQHKLLDRDIGSIDLRLPDRVVVKERHEKPIQKSQRRSPT
jgi:cell division protein FtsQ